MTTPLMSRVKSQRKTVVELFALGFALAVIGFIIVAAYWPSTTADFVGGQVVPVDHGSSDGVLVGFGLVGLGEIFAGIAIVAWGVRYGIESAIPNTPITVEDVASTATAVQTDMYDRPV